MSHFTGAFDSCAGTAAANNVLCLNDTQGTITTETLIQTQLPIFTAAALGAYLDVYATATRTQIDAVEALGYDDPRHAPGPVTVGVDAVGGRDYTPLVHDALPELDKSFRFMPQYMGSRGDIVRRGTQSASAR